MQKLKAIIERHRRWKDLEIVIGRIEAHKDVDFSLSLENAKALLETIGKEICDAKSVTLPAAPSMNSVLKHAFKAIGYKGDDLVTQVSTALANIAQQMGNLLNDIGLTSHGMTLEDLKNRNDTVDHLTKELLIDTTEIVAAFLIRGFEAISPFVPAPHIIDEISEYENNPDFNDFWDDSFGDFSMGDYSYSASEILYNVDPQAYATERKMFNV